MVASIRFDTAEGYAAGNSEIEMYVPQMVLTVLGCSYSVYTGVASSESSTGVAPISSSRQNCTSARARAPTTRGCHVNSKFYAALPCELSNRRQLLLSIIEGTKESLERLGLDYVDVLFAHRPDSSGEWSETAQGARIGLIIR